VPNADVPWLAKAANPPVEDTEDLGKLGVLKPLWPNAGDAGFPRLGTPNAGAAVPCPNDDVGPEPPLAKVDTGGVTAWPEPPAPKAD